MALCSSLPPFLYDQVPAPEDTSGLQLSQEQLQEYLARLLDAVCGDIEALEGGGSGAATFLGLTDTPSSYSGHAGKRVVVNGTENGLEFETIVGSPDSDGLTLDYSTTEQQTNRTYTGGQAIFQKTINFGTLPNATTKSVAHGIGVDFQVIRHEFWTRRASDGVQIVVPHVHQTTITNQAAITIDATNINVISSANLSPFDGQVTIWYIKI